MENTPAQRQKSPIQLLKETLSADVVKQRFQDILSDNSGAFIASILSLANTDSGIAQCEPNSVINAAMVAATLKLPINKSLGLAYVVPYDEKQKDGTYVKKAQFQIGYKGLVQLCVNTGLFRRINVIEVYEGQLIKADRFNEIFEFDESAQTGNNVIGIYAYFETVSGYVKKVYWTIDMVEKHGKAFSKSYDSKYGRWQNDTTFWMRKKTVLKNMIDKWAPKSIEIQKAILSDQAVIKNPDLTCSECVEYVDAEDLTNQKQIDSAVKPNDSKLFDETPNK